MYLYLKTKESIACKVQANANTDCPQQELHKRQ